VDVLAGQQLAHHLRAGFAQLRVEVEAHGIEHGG